MDIYQPSVTVTIGDDWVFSFNCTNPAVTPGTVVNLIGYIPSALLYMSSNLLFTVSGSNVNISQLNIGLFTLTIPRSTTVNFTPDDTAYRLRVLMVDPNNLQNTYLVIPLKVQAI